MPIRFKLFGVLVVPLMLVLGLVYFEISGATREVNQVRDQADLATAITGPQGVLTALQDERNWAVVELIGAGDMINLEVTGLDETRALTDTAIAEFAENLESRDEAVVEAYQPAMDGLADLEQVRREVSSYDGPQSLDPADIEYGSDIFVRYADMIAAFFDAGTSLTLDVDQRPLRLGAELVDASSRQIEVIASIAHVTLTNFDLDRRDLIVELAELEESFHYYVREMRLNDDEPYRELVTEQFPEAFTTDMTGVLEETLETGAVDLATMLDLLDAPDEDSYVRFRNEAAIALDDEAARYVAGAERTRQIYIVVAVVVVAGTITASWLASRSITRPLRSLTEQATDMADERLPQAVQQILDTPLGADITVPAVDPVEVRARDEVIDVADALNTVQDSALNLAIEQAALRRNIADSFVNLGRRNQNLLGRQLDFITELEQNEADPDTLADLFRLDHLATRMRRNAESLLVLAGIEPPRKWTVPVKITDVVRSALGEVESYQRVVVRSMEPATVMGTVAADLAHLLAELIENALTFSPPDQHVEIRGRLRSAPSDPLAGPTGGYTLAVIDVGLGMDPGEMERANRRLAGAESFTVAPSKYLGHYVAGNLAARHGIEVRLQPSPTIGVTATVDLPAGLLAAESGVAGGLPASAPPPAFAPPSAPELPSPETVRPDDRVAGLDLPAPPLPVDLRALDGPPPSPDREPLPARTPLQAREASQTQGPLPAQEPLAGREPLPRREALQARGPRQTPEPLQAREPLEGREPLRARDSHRGQAPPTQPTTIPPATRSLPDAAPPASGTAGGSGWTLGEGFRPPPREGENGPSGTGGPHRRGHGPSHSPDQVQSFLSSFTAGVRRGLDEAQRYDTRGPDDPLNGHSNGRH